MGKKQNKPLDAADEEQPPVPATKDKHLAKKMVRVDDTIHALFRELAEENNRPMSRELRSAHIEYLKKHGKWPPPPKSKQ